MTTTALELEETTESLSLTDGAYIHLAGFHRGQIVVIHTPAGGRQRGIVNTPLRDFSNHIERAFMIVKVYGIRHRVRVMDVLSGKYWVAPVLPAGRHATAEAVCRLAS